VYGGSAGICTEWSESINCLAYHVQQAALDLCPYGHGYGASGSIHFQTPGKTIGRVHGNSAHCVVPDMLLYFQYDLLTIGTAYFQCMAYRRQLHVFCSGGEHNVHNRADYL